MKSVCERYAEHVNYLQKRKGHLFEGPYAMKNFDERRHLLYMSKYVHLNPVHGHIVKKLEDWPYTSWHQYLKGEDNGLVTTKAVLGLAGGIEAYHRYLTSNTAVENEDMEVYVIDRELP